MIGGEATADRSVGIGIISAPRGVPGGACVAVTARGVSAWTKIGLLRLRAGEGGAVATVVVAATRRIAAVVVSTPPLALSAGAAGSVSDAMSTNSGTNSSSTTTARPHAAAHRAHVERALARAACFFARCPRCMMLTREGAIATPLARRAIAKPRSLTLCAPELSDDMLLCTVGRSCSLFLGLYGWWARGTRRGLGK